MRIAAYYAFFIAPYVTNSEEFAPVWVAGRATGYPL